MPQFDSPKRVVALATKLAVVCIHVWPYTRTRKLKLTSPSTIRPTAKRALPTTRVVMPVALSVTMPCLTGFEDKPLPPYSPQNPFYQGQIENPWTPPAQRWAAIKTIKTVIQGAEITDDVLAECVKLFNANFGTWSKLAKNQRNKGVPGTPA